MDCICRKDDGMNVLQNLIELYDHLAADSTYRSVVRKILMNLKEAADANVYELAALTESSRTTVWRMLQLMGYERFGDFHYALKQAVGHYTYYNRILPVSRMHTEEDIILEAERRLECAVRDVKQDLNLEQIQKTARRIMESDGLYFFFPYRTPAMGSFQQNLAMAGVETNVVCLLPDMLACSETMGERCVVFCMTIEHAETQDMTEIFERLQEHGAYTVLFSGSESRYDEYVKQQLCAEPKGGSALESVVRFEMYILALSEVFRKMYLE